MIKNYTENGYLVPLRCPAGVQAKMAAYAAACQTVEQQRNACKMRAGALAVETSPAVEEIIPLGIVIVRGVEDGCTSVLERAKVGVVVFGSELRDKRRGNEPL